MVRFVSAVSEVRFVRFEIICGKFHNFAILKNDQLIAQTNGNYWEKTATAQSKLKTDFEDTFKYLIRK